jgi:hypothetical protein
MSEVRLMVFKMRLPIAVMIILLSVFCAAASADDDYYIPVPEQSYGRTKSSDIAADQKFFVGNGFAMDWPEFMKWPGTDTWGSSSFNEKLSKIPRQELLDAMPDYYRKLAMAREGAELVNQSAFDIYRNISDDDRTDALYFSPYGVYSSLWDLYASSAPEAVNDFYNEKNRIPITRLKEMIFKSFAHKMTIREEYQVNKDWDEYPLAHKDLGYFDAINSDAQEGLLACEEVWIHATKAHDNYHPLGGGALRHRMNGSFLNISNSVSSNHSDIQEHRDKSSRIRVDLYLINSTSLALQMIIAGALRIEDVEGMWCAFPKWSLYGETDEVEVFRVRFSTLKHSLLFIYPKKPGNFKKIEKNLNPEYIKNLLKGMKPGSPPLLFGQKIFGDASEEHLTLSDLELSTQECRPSIKASLGDFKIGLINKVSFSTGGITEKHEDLFALSLLGWYSPRKSKVENISLDALLERYENVVLLGHPFLFFVIDDPTGAILLMGRSPGYKKASN